MKRIFLILFAFATICSARQITTSNYTNTPYRERMKSSVSSAILIGVPGTATAADTCVGTYIYSFQMHQFPVEKSGFYLLYEDVLGGTSYTRRTDWSTISGKYVPGKSTAWPEVTSIFDYFDSYKGSPVWNDSIIFLNADQGRDSSFFNVGLDSIPLYDIRGMINVREPSNINIPGNVVIAANRDYSHTSGGVPTISVAATHDVTISGGIIYGRGDSSLYNNAQTEHDSGIEITSSNDVRVNNTTILSPSGDGITVNSVYFPTWSDLDTSYYKVASNRVNIHGGSIYSPTYRIWNHPVNQQIGRNGIAIIDGKDVIISGVNIRGGMPACIDIEGNAAVSDSIDNLIITGCILDGLSYGRYKVGSVVSDTEFYLKSVNSGNLNLDSNVLAGISIASPTYGNISCGFGATTDSWKVVSGNTATSGGNTTITFADAFDSDPTGYYVVIYDHDEDWPALPDTSDLFGDGLIASANITSPYSITVTGITATLNQLANYRVYFTSNPAYAVKRHIESNSASVADSVLVTLNDSFLGLTPIQGTYMGLGDSYGCGILITGASRYRNIIITNNIIKNTYSYGIRFQGSALDTTHKLILANNRFENCHDVAIETAGSRDADITNNTIYNSTIGINIMGIGHNTVSGNSIKSCTVGGIWVLGNAGNDSTGTIVNNVISNNVVEECGHVIDTYPAASIRMDWSRDSACYGNTIINTDTSTSVYQKAIRYNYCKNLYAGTNHVIGYDGNIWWGEGCTYENTLFSLNSGYIGVNKSSDTYRFIVADSINGINYTAIGGGVIYPNAANASNKIGVTGAHLFIQGGSISSLSVTDSSGVRKDIVVASIDSTDAQSTSIRGSVTLPDIVKANTYDATAAGELWVNTSHDTLWYSVNGTNAAYILIDGYIAKH